MIALDSPWPIPHEGILKKDVKMISTQNLSKTVKQTHILHAKSYPQFSSGTDGYKYRIKQCANYSWYCFVVFVGSRSNMYCSELALELILIPK